MNGTDTAFREGADSVTGTSAVCVTPWAPSGTVTLPTLTRVAEDASSSKTVPTATGVAMLAPAEYPSTARSESVTEYDSVGSGTVSETTRTGMSVCDAVSP